MTDNQIHWEGGSVLPESTVNDAENEFGFKFPPAFRLLISEHDGARPECWIVGFHNPNGGNLDVETELSALISLRTSGDRDHDLSPFTEINRRVSSHSPGYIVFAEDIGGNSFAFDFTKSSDPTIVLIPAFEFDPIYVAENYNEFVKAAMTSDPSINSEIS